MASLDHAVGHHDKIDKPDIACGEVQEGLFRSGDGQAFAKGGLSRIFPIVRTDALSNLASMGRGQGDMRGPIGRDRRAPQFGRRVVADE